MITSMLFFPEKEFYDKPENYGLQCEDVNILTEDGLHLHGWFLWGMEDGESGVVKSQSPSPNPYPPTLLFFHGNAGNISGRLFKAKGWIDRGFNVLLVDYRSYGKSEGEIKHEKDLVIDGQSALDWLVREKNVSLSNVIVYGESLGTYVATHLAAKNSVGAVILEAPFTSFLDIANKHYPMIPGKNILMKDFIFSNRESVSKLKSPLFILHGTKDETCAYEMGEELFSLAISQKEFFSIEGGAHNDLPEKAGIDYWEKPYQFLKKYGGCNEEKE